MNEIRKLIEHNKKILTEDYHLDYKKVITENSKVFGEKVKQEVGKFSDSEINEASILGTVLMQKDEPEDGFIYQEVAIGLWGEMEDVSRI